VKNIYRFSGIEQDVRATGPLNTKNNIVIIFEKKKHFNLVFALSIPIALLIPV